MLNITLCEIAGILLEDSAAFLLEDLVLPEDLALQISAKMIVKSAESYWNTLKRFDESL